MAYLPNCCYCGKFVNPDKPGCDSVAVYGWMSLDRIDYFHIKCKEKSIKQINHDQA